MWVAVLKLDLHIPGARSRKDRRQVVKSLKERLRNRFSAGVAEVGDLNTWTRASLGVTTCAHDKGSVEDMVASIERYAQQDPGAMIGRIEKDVFRFGETGEDGAASYADVWKDDEDDDSGEANSDVEGPGGSKDEGLDGND